MIKKTRLFFILTVSLIVSAFTSCGYEPVFFGIMNDVAPETAMINGNINSIVRYTIDGTENLFIIGNGELQYKNADSNKHGEWKTYPVPFEIHHYNYYPLPNSSEGHHGEQILKIASDNDYIYILSATYYTDKYFGKNLPENFFIRSKKITGTESSDGWNIIVSSGNESEAKYFPTEQDSDTGSLSTNFNLFCSNAISQTGRKAFFRSADKYYQLSGTSITETTPGTDYPVIKTPDSKNTKLDGAVYLNNTIYLVDSYANTTNADETIMYFAGRNDSGTSTKDIYYATSSADITKALSISNPVVSLAATANSLIIGNGNFSSSYTSNGGISRVELNSAGIPDTETSEFSNNAPYQFTSSYIVMALLCATPDQNESDAIIYASTTFRGSGSSSTASFENTGLWSYYPTRKNWNRE